MDLDTLRVEMDEINRGMLALLLRRMDVAKRIGAYKREHGMPIHVPEREASILAWAREQAGDEMAPFAEQFFTCLMDLAKQAE